MNARVDPLAVVKYAIDDFVERRTAFKIVCRTCRRGPADGISVRKVGWIWTCIDHPLPRKKTL